MKKTAISILGVMAGLAVAVPASADYEFRSLAGNTCLGVQSASKTSGANLVVWSCDNSYNQRWNQVAFWTTDSRFAHMTTRVLEKQNPFATPGNRCLGLNGSNAAVSLSCNLNDADPDVDGWWADFYGFYTINLPSGPTSTPCYSFKSKTNTMNFKYLTTTGVSGNQPTLQSPASPANFATQVWCPVPVSGMPN